MDIPTSCRQTFATNVYLPSLHLAINSCALQLSDIAFKYVVFYLIKGGKPEAKKRPFAV